MIGPAPSTVVPTTGKWDHSERGTYFIATSPDMALRVLAQHERDEVKEPLFILLAVNDISPDAAPQIEAVEKLLDAGVRVLLDSGVFWLTNRHMRAHGITMDEALGLHPNEIDGFDWLWDRYTRLVDRFGADLWGVIELDQGGAARKRETRARLHDLGIFPIPVYHPLGDGWDYFDELAETTDRMCLGNIVQARAPVRMRLLATAYERKRAHPHLWIHVLGYSMATLLFPYPIESCDSSSWTATFRWGHVQLDRAMLRATGQPLVGLRYTNTVEGATHEKAEDLAAGIWRTNIINYQHHLGVLEEILGDDTFR